MKDVVRLVAVILVCQLPPVPKTAPARDFGRKHQRINGDDDHDIMMLIIMLIMNMIIIIIIKMIFQKTTPVRDFRRKHKRINYALQKNQINFQYYFLFCKRKNID